MILRVSSSSVPGERTAACRTRAIGRPVRPAARLLTGGGRTSGWGGAAVGAVHGGRARGRQRSVGRGDRAQLRARLLHLEPRAGVMAQGAAQLVVQRDARGGMLRLDMN